MFVEGRFCTACCEDFCLGRCWGPTRVTQQLASYRCILSSICRALILVTSLSSPKVSGKCHWNCLMMASRCWSALSTVIWPRLRNWVPWIVLETTDRCQFQQEISQNSPWIATSWILTKRCSHPLWLDPSSGFQRRMPSLSHILYLLFVHCNLV